MPAHSSTSRDAALGQLWPISGKPGQDVIVHNPMGLDRSEEPQTRPDYQAQQWVATMIMEEHAHVRGYPPLDLSNPSAGRDNVVGGVHMRGNTGWYSINSRGDIKVQDDATEMVGPVGGPFGGGGHHGHGGGGSGGGGGGGGHHGGGGGGHGGGGGGGGYISRILREEQAFGKHMGKSATTNPHPQSQSNAQPQQPQSNPIDGLIFLLLVLGGAAAWYFFYYKKHHGKGAGEHHAEGHHEAHHSALEHVR